MKKKLNFWIGLMLGVVALLGVAQGLRNRFIDTFDTVADLVANGGKAFPVVHVLGYYSPGDGGGGTFLLTNAVSGTNFGSRIYSSRLGQSWERVIVNNTFTLRQFGGDPNGVLDSRDNLQALLNACRNKGITAKIDGNFRIVSTKPIIIGKVSRIEGPGKLWNSLPDGYVWSGNYSTTETYTDSSVLDENGSWVSWSWTSTAGIPPYAPWNGKTEMFHDATDCVIEGLKVDGGWGTTTVADGKPSGVIPITGLQPPTNPIEEYGYYQMFYNSKNTRYHKCEFTNIPGDCIEVGERVAVVDCTFTEYGDHVVYMGHTGANVQLIGNRIINGRAASGTPGAADYVWQTQRESFKFRGTDNLVVVGNTLTNTSKQINAFITLQTAASQPSDLDGFVIANNRVSAGGFVYFAVDRPDGSQLLTIRNGKITDNQFDLSGYFMHTSAGAALANVDVTGNTGACNIFAAVMGHPYVTNAIDNLSFENNKVRFVNSVAAGFYLAGNINKISIKKNTFIGLEPTSPSSNVMLSGYVAANYPMGMNNQWHQINEVVLEDNTARNFMSWWGDGGFDAYDNAKTYAYGTHVNSEGTYEDFSVVSSGGVLYRNIAATTGNAPPNATYWAVYTPPTTTVRADRNTRYSSTAARSPNNAKYLFGRAGTANKQTLSVVEWGNVNVTTTTDQVDYQLGNQASRLNTFVSGGASPMTKAQRNGISSPFGGLTIYQTDSTPGLRVYENGAWMKYTATADP